jgi:hypothetical protein
MPAKRSLIGRVLIGLIRLYQLTLSPLLGRRCRFYPTCSAYAVEAIRKKGALRGAAMAFWRILRCNPLNDGGYDPVEGDGASGEREERRGAETTDPKAPP